MTSARRGEGGFKNCLILRTNSTDRLREMRTRGRGGVKNLGIFADVLNVWSLSMLSLAIKSHYDQSQN